MRNRKLTIAIALIGSTVLTMTGCASSTSEAGSGDSGEIVVASYGGSFQDAQKAAFFTPFQDESGVTVLDTEGTGFDKLTAMADSGDITWDVITAESGAFANEVAAGLLEPLDYSVIDTTGLPEEMVSQYGVGYMQFSMNLAFDAEKFDDMTPAEFFDPTIKARRALPTAPHYVFEFALLADGVEPENLYPLDVDRAFSVLDRVRDQIIGFRDYSDIQSLVQQGEVDAVLLPNGRAMDAIDAGAKWKYTWDDAVRDTEYWAIPKGAANTADAMEFIDFAIKAEQQATLSETIPYGPTNVDALNELDSELVATLPTAPENADKGVSLDATWWAENLADVQTQWDAWVLQ